MTEDLRIPKKQIEFTGRLFDYKEFRKHSDTFIETGCANGDGVQRALDAGFEAIESIEAATEWFVKSSRRFTGSSKVEICFGKSTDMLHRAINNFFPTEPIVFYLDAHSSGNTSFGHKECIAGEPEFQQDNIIKQELNIILSNYNKHIICIDDVNGLTDGHAEEYMQICLNANPDYKFQFWDEQLDPKGPRYKDKILTAII
jgi:hypothetical protein